MNIFTIGFTRKSAEKFFGLLRQPGLVRLVDIRLKNVSQLAGFTKKDDLRFFVRTIAGLDYAHLPELAPSQEILQRSKEGRLDWAAYETEFLALLAQRKAELNVNREMLQGSCLLCSEPSPQYCHRRLVAEYLQTHWGNLNIRHLE